MDEEDNGMGEDRSFVVYVLYFVVNAFVLYLLRTYFKGGQFTERASAKGKVAVVTGANSGLGYETVQELNLRGAKVYMLCRSEEKAEQARRELVKRGCDPTRLIYVHCDLAAFSSVRTAVEALEKAEGHIDILVNNAAILGYPKFELTVDNHELTWQSNYLGPFLLTELLLPLLEKSEDGRIVNVSSKLHERVKTPLDLDAIDTKKEFSSFLAPYNKTKLANVMHARELSKRLRSKGIHNISINALHPGLCVSDLNKYIFLGKPPFSYILAPLKFLVYKTAKDGSQTSLYLALSKYAKGITGYYFADCKRTSESALALVDTDCETLYNYSLQATGLSS